jgi:hypothetical protein
MLGILLTLFSEFLSCFKYDYKSSIVHTSVYTQYDLEKRKKEKNGIKKYVHIIDTPLQKICYICMIYV